MAVADTAAKEGQSRLESELRQPALKYCSSCLFLLLSCFNPDPHLRAREAVLHFSTKVDGRAPDPLSPPSAFLRGMKKTSSQSGFFVCRVHGVSWVENEANPSYPSS